MMIPCKHWRDCGVNGGGCCAINAYERPSFGVCLRVCKQYVGPPREESYAQLVERIEQRDALESAANRYRKRYRPGLFLRRAVHFALDCIDAIPLVRPRARHRLWIIDQIKTCGGCTEREILIDYYCLHLAHKLRRWFAKEAT